MSKGNAGYHWRCPPELEQAMLKQIEMSFVTRKETPWTVSDFIRIAIREKLAKMIRCRKYRPRSTKMEFGENETFDELPGFTLPDDNDDGDSVDSPSSLEESKPINVTLDDIEGRAIENLVTYGFPPYLSPRLLALARAEQKD